MSGNAEENKAYSLDVKEASQDYLKVCIDFQNWIEKEFKLSRLSSTIVATIAIEQYSTLISENPLLKTGISRNIEALRTQIKEKIEELGDLET